jgi:hypothetical protein
MLILIVVSRTSIRPFCFTLNQVPSKIEILVRTGTILPIKKPSKAEKGLQDVSSRDGDIYPVLLAPILQRPDLQQFEPDSTAVVPVVEEGKNPAKDWVEGLNSLGKGTVEMSREAVPIREIKRVEWRDLTNIVLFRYHCGNCSLF